MVRVPNSMRPGVYISSSVRPVALGIAGRTAAAVGLASEEAEAGKPVRIETAEEADALGEGSALCRMVRVLLGAGCAPVWAVPAGEDYAQAFAAAVELPVQAVVSDGGGEAFAAHLDACRSAGRERLGVLAVGDPAQAAGQAQALNCERLAIACDGGSRTEETAAAFTALIVREGAQGRYNGAELPLPAEGFDGALSDAQVQALLRSGATPFERIGTDVACVRAVTTRTRTDGLEDRTFSSVSTVLAVDEVVSSLRGAVRARLRGLKNTPATRESIASQLTVELEARRLEGLIDSFQPPAVTAHPQDRSVCIATLMFSVAPEISQIVISAEISI